jgi:hypothetical protein
MDKDKADIKPQSPDKDQPRDEMTKKFLDRDKNANTNAKPDSQDAAGNMPAHDATDATNDRRAPASKEPADRPAAKQAPAERNPAVPETKEEVNPQGADHALDAHTGEGRDFKGSAAMDTVKPY